MCHHARIREIAGLRYVEYVDLDGRVEFRIPLAPLPEPKEEEQPMLVRTPKPKRIVS